MTTTTTERTAADFLAKHSPSVIELAKARDALVGNAAISPLLEAIYADFEALPPEDKPGRREALPGENVLWWCVTILEEVEEMRPPATDPYFAMMRDQLAAMGERLQAREDLPPAYGIHWFNEDDD